MDLDPKVIAHRSPKTQGEMLVNPSAYEEFCCKAQLQDQVSCRSTALMLVCSSAIACMSCLYFPAVLRCSCVTAACCEAW